MNDTHLNLNLGFTLIINNNLCDEIYFNFYTVKVQYRHVARLVLRTSTLLLVLLPRASLGLPPRHRHLAHRHLRQQRRHAAHEAVADAQRRERGAAARVPAAALDSGVLVLFVRADRGDGRARVWSAEHARRAGRVLARRQRVHVALHPGRAAHMVPHHGHARHRRRRLHRRDV